MILNNIVSTLPYTGVKTNKLVANDTGTITLISIEKDNILVEHKSATDASILLLEGEVAFTINGTEHILKTHDLYAFKKEERHAIKAITNAKLILIK